MTNIPSSSSPPPSLWKLISLTLLGTFALGFPGCSGLLLSGGEISGFGRYLLYATWFFYGLFLLTLVFAAGYFRISLFRRWRPR
jgi:hypothetical protein